MERPSQQQEYADEIYPEPAQRTTPKRRRSIHDQKKKCSHPDCDRKIPWADEACKKHRCKASLRCGKIRAPNSDVCTDHQCQVDGCPESMLSAELPERSERAEEVQSRGYFTLYCDKHACRTCYDLCMISSRNGREEIQPFCRKCHYDEHCQENVRRRAAEEARAAEEPEDTLVEDEDEHWEDDQHMHWSD